MRYTTEVEMITLPRDIAERIVRFLDFSAGEGFCFEFNREYDTLAADSILYEWFGDKMESWVPQDIQEAWSGGA